MVVPMNSIQAMPTKKIQCQECGATAARNGNQFTSFTLQAHIRRMHGMRKRNGKVKPYALTQRQHSIMKLVLNGMIESEMAKELGLSYHTVHEHVRKIYVKLGVRNRTQAATKWLQRKATLKTSGKLVKNKPRPAPVMNYCPGCGCSLTAPSTTIRAQV